MRHQITDTPRLSVFRSLLFALSLLLFAACDYPDLTVPKPNENIRPAADFIKNNYDFRLFYAALEYTGLVDELNGEGPFTVLVPGDDAFNQLGIYLPEDFQKLDRDSLRQVLMNHVLANRRLLTTDMPTNGVDVRFETLAGEQLYASAADLPPGGTVSQDRVFFNGSEVIRKNIILQNGVLHVLDKVMKYHKGKTVQAFLEESPEYSIYVAGLRKFGLWDELAQTGPFTIFPPDNQAFENNGVTLEFVNSMDVEMYNGARLFGAYILYGKHYFKSDRDVFYIINNEFTFQLNLRDDDWYLQFDRGPVLRLYRLLNGFPELLGTASGEAAPSKLDNLCENGIVHHLDGLMVLPEKTTR